MTDLTPNDLSHLSDEEFIALYPQGEHAPGPEPLSPAAQAIFFAADGMQPRQYRGRALGAALRAAVLKCEYCDDYGTSFIDPKDLLAIATELEGQ